jgi:hypothetical protein
MLGPYVGLRSDQLQVRWDNGPIEDYPWPPIRGPLAKTKGLDTIHDERHTGGRRDDTGGAR